MSKPMLLAPAGSYDALCAAISAGADEIYFGSGEFNARAFAKGFSEQELLSAFKLCKLHNVKTNITLNTLVSDRELESAIEKATHLHSLGADAFIVQDLGLAKRLSQSIEGVEMHASTQCACHNSDGAKLLHSLGFSKIVLARELSGKEIQSITAIGKKEGFETEAFVHGALCVSHSGQCLMSSVIGERSGNRGMCAQPCRMQGSVCDCRQGYPLSMCDLTLAGHIEEILQYGVTSLKIEGRMKSPEYVYRVVSVWRRLLDNGTNATEEDIRLLSDIFSRGGFTDGYFTGEYRRDNRRMYGVRSDADKQKTRQESFEVPKIPPIPIKLSFEATVGSRASLRAECRGYTVQALSENIVESARLAPIDEAFLKRNLSKLGATEFTLEQISISVSGNAFMSAGEINALRRNAVALLEQKLITAQEKSTVATVKAAAEDIQSGKRTPAKRVEKRAYVDCIEKLDEALRFADSVYFPLQMFSEGADSTFVTKIKIPFGVRLPRVFFDSEASGIQNALERAKACGAGFAEVSNIGHIDCVKQSGLRLCGGIGLNLYNSLAFGEYARLGFGELTLSPELNTAQMRDIRSAFGVRTCVFYRGRLPLMTLESCIIRANNNGKCISCKDNRGYCGTYRDRIGKEFYIFGEQRFEKEKLPCRNIILNSVETNLESKKGASDINADVHIIAL